MIGARKTAHTGSRRRIGGSPDGAGPRGQGRAGGLQGCRSEFPALGMSVAGRPVVFLDGPGGTQVPASVGGAVTDYLYTKNANSHGMFATSRATDDLVELARRRLAELLGAASPEEIAFGQNMTTLNFHLSRMLARDLRPGDEVVITELDHEANRAPWMALRECGVVVREVRVDPVTCRLDMDDFAGKAGARTKIVAVGGASNAVGTVNDLATIHRLARGAGALLVVDAVHYVPHLPVDVVAMGCDFLLCSAYKFFGPHLGILYGRREAFESLRCHKVEPQLESIPYRIETGTPNFEGIAAAAAAVEFIASLGASAPAGQEAGSPRLSVTHGPPGVQSTRRSVLSGMQAIERYELELSSWLLEGLSLIPGLTLYGPPAGTERTPTFSFAVDGLDAAEVAGRLGEEGIFVWDGDFYATTLIRRLGLVSRGGLVRLGLAPYNTGEEVERTVEALRTIVAR